MSDKITNNFNLIPPSIDNALKNLTDEPTKCIGTTLADIWYLVFGVFSASSQKRRAKYQNDVSLFKKELEVSSSLIPDEKKIDPSIQITAQALDSAKFCISQPELRKMFVSLITNSMNRDYANDIHPSFAEMLKQMTPTDAYLLNWLKNEYPRTLPICDYWLVHPGGGHSVIAEKIFLELPNYSFEQISISLTSLSRFGLVSIPNGTSIKDERFYKKFKEYSIYQSLKEKFPGQTISISKGIISLTPLGNLFCKICIPNELFQ